MTRQSVEASWKRKLEEEVARRRSSKEWAAFGFAFERFFVRTFRIAAGIGFGLLVLWLINEAGDTLSKPATQLSPLGLLRVWCSESRALCAL